MRFQPVEPFTSLASRWVNTHHEQDTDHVSLTSSHFCKAKRNLSILGGGGKAVEGHQSTIGVLQLFEIALRQALPSIDSERFIAILLDLFSMQLLDLAMKVTDEEGRVHDHVAFEQTQRPIEHLIGETFSRVPLD